MPAVQGNRHARAFVDHVRGRVHHDCVQRRYVVNSMSEWPRKTLSHDVRHAEMWTRANVGVQQVTFARGIDQGRMRVRGPPRLQPGLQIRFEHERSEAL